MSLAKDLCTQLCAVWCIAVNRARIAIHCLHCVAELCVCLELTDLRACPIAIAASTGCVRNTDSFEAC
jgi:hypothetical protein